MDELTRAKERIDIKAEIHRELGQALLITRRYVLNETDSSDAPIFIWKKNVSMLARKSEFTNEETPWWQFLESAEASGVRVELSGSLPVDRKQNGLCVTAAVECLVNGVRHADTRTLWITVTEAEEEFSVIFENDGALPQGEIVEGGGLSSLRHRTQRLNGRMEVRSTPRFSLILTLPRERGQKG